MPDINLILSGGGAKSVAHLGVIKALLEYKCTIHAVSGVSGGAIAGAFIAKGMHPDEILEIAVEHGNFSIRRPPFSLALFNKTNLEKVLLKYFTEDSFNVLRMPLHVSATNINEGRTDYFSSGELIKPLVASSALPVFFAPIKINEYQYLDGGLLNNLPVEPFVKNKTTRIGVHVNPVATEMNILRTIKIIERTSELSIYKSILPRKRHCHLFIEPQELKQFSIYDFDRAREIFKIGYEYAKPRIEKFFGSEEPKKELA